jgi:hypothetical protein
MNIIEQADLHVKNAARVYFEQLDLVKEMLSGKLHPLDPRHIPETAKEIAEEKTTA